MNRRLCEPEELDRVLDGVLGRQHTLDAASLDLGGASVRVESNALDRILDRFHESHVSPADGRFDWRFVLVEQPLAEHEARTISRHENSYRADVLSRGVIVGHHLGGPIGMRSLGAREYLYVGEGMAALFWSLLVKVVLTLNAARENAVHVKAAGVDVGGRALLLAGRSKSGKTAVALRLHELGCDLMANTHLVWGRRGVTGLATAVRARHGHTERTIATDELRWCRDVRPVALLAALTAADVPLPTIRYGGRGFWPLVLHFGLATLAYDLKEDVCDFADSHDHGFQVLAREQALLETLTRETPTVEVALDPLEQQHVEHVARELMTTLGGEA
jgi:hypothetical protein